METRLRESIERIIGNGERPARQDVSNAREYAASMPEATTQAVFGASKTVTVCLKALLVLAPASSSFRLHVADELREPLRSVHRAAAVRLDSKKRSVARRILKRYAFCIESWMNTYGASNESVIPYRHLMDELPLLKDFVEANGGKRSRNLESERTRDVRNLRNLGLSEELLATRPELLCTHAYMILAELRDIFQAIGEMGLRELGSGRLEAIDEELRDVWARLVRAEEKISRLALKLRHALSRDIGTGLLRRGFRLKVSDMLACLTDCMLRIGKERCFCRSLSVKVPDRTPFEEEDGPLHEEEEDNIYEWDDPVFVASDSDSENDEFVPCAAETGDVTTMRATDRLPGLANLGGSASADAQKALSDIGGGREAGKRNASKHNAALLGIISRESKRGGRSKTGGGSARDRLKAKLEKSKRRR